VNITEDPTDACITECFVRLLHSTAKQQITQSLSGNSETADMVQMFELIRDMQLADKQIAPSFCT